MDSMDTCIDGMVWRYRALAPLVYELDKPIGTSFGVVEFCTDWLRGCPAQSWSLPWAPAGF
ncbi:hypothetical protein [Streptomyces katsurahamanus]|uniref:hypothetical protein n=1 Tax=Streptomyces katsurahamanus TaxID=2577098 RepID=UPI0018865202|nr:hypothetical protein [Streptomyces katsurahamanus]